MTAPRVAPPGPRGQGEEVDVGSIVWDTLDEWANTVEPGPRQFRCEYLTGMLMEMYCDGPFQKVDVGRVVPHVESWLKSGRGVLR